MTATEERVLPKIISVDDHVVEPPHGWQTWLPERFRALTPEQIEARIDELARFVM